MATDSITAEKQRLMQKRQERQKKAAAAARSRIPAAAETVATPEVEVSIEDMTNERLRDMSTKLQKTSTVNTSVALPMVDKSRELTDRDVVIPKVRIAQAMSEVAQKGEISMGNWYHSTQPRDLGKEIFVIPVDMYKTRSYFVTGAGVMCRSFDMVQGEGNPGVLCEGTVEEQSTLPANERGCPLRLWGERDPVSKRSEPPKCGESYNYPVIICTDPNDLENGRALRGIMTFRSTGIGTAKQINTLKMEGDYDWWDMVLKIGLESKTNSFGTFFVPGRPAFVAESAGKARELAIKLAGVVNPTTIRATLEADPE